MPRAAHAARENMGGGKLATLAILFLLLVVGFGIGLLAGAAYEDPALMMEHLRGRTEHVPLSPPPSPPTVADEAAPAAQPAPAPPASARSTAGTARAAAPAPPASAREAAITDDNAPTTAMPQASASGRFVVQVGAYANETAARQLAGSLLELGLPVYITRGSGRSPFRVRVGRFASRAEAEQVAHRLKREQRLPTWVTTQER